MQLPVQQPDLAQMFGQDNLYNTLYGLQRQDQANANNAQNVSQAQQDQQFQAQNQPFLLQQLVAEPGHTNAMTALAQAQTPGAAAESTLKGNAATLDTATLPQQKDAKIAKIAAGLTEDQARQHQAQATSDLFATNADGTPDIQKRTDAATVLQHMPDIVAKMAEIRQQGANAAGVAGIEGGNQLALEKQQAADGKYYKSTSEGISMKALGGNYQAQAGEWTRMASVAAAKANSATDPTVRMQYLQEVEEYKNNAAQATANGYREKQALGATNATAKPNLNALGVPTVADPSTIPTPPQVTDPTQSTMVPMKDKNGVPHLVPRGNVQKALSGGWTQ